MIIAIIKPIICLRYFDIISFLAIALCFSLLSKPSTIEKSFNGTVLTSKRNGESIKSIKSS